MEKENLINGIYAFDKDLKDCIQQTEKDLAFKKDILTINIKHGKNTESIEKEIYELQIMLRTLEQTKGMLVDDLSENDVEIKDIIEYCEEQKKMNKKEAYKILTDNNQKVLDSINPLQINKKWVEAYHIAVNNLNGNIEESEKNGYKG